MRVDSELWFSATAVADGGNGTVVGIGLQLSGKLTKLGRFRHRGYLEADRKLEKQDLRCLLRNALHLST